MELKIVAMLFLVILLNFEGQCSADRRNNSAAGIRWATIKDGDALEKEAEANDQTISSSSESSFSSLDSMLQWAIGHSDPEKLKGTAEEVKKLTPKELERRQTELKELLEKLKMPSDADLMKIAIADLMNLTLSVEDHLRALQELLVLVEPIDNANDLNKLGGLTALIQELDSKEENLRTLAAWVLGKASQNNPLLQKQILESGVLPKLMGMVKSSFPEEAVKALFAVSAVIRNNQEGQAFFYTQNGILMLREIMANSSTDLRLLRKSLFLVADLAEQSFQDSSASSLEVDNDFLKSIVDLLASSDMDIQEKTLMAVKSLLQIRNQNAHVFKDFCQLDLALENLGHQIRDLMSDSEWGDFAVDIEALRQEVISMLNAQLE